MKPSILSKLEALQERYQVLATQLSDSQVINDQQRFRELSKEYAALGDLVTNYRAYLALQREKEEVTKLLENVELKELAKEEWEQLLVKEEVAIEQIKWLLLPKEEEDSCNVFLEIRAGTGGDEAAIFAGDLFRMYSYFVEHSGWQMEIVSQSHGEHGGYKEIITRIMGKGVYAKLKFESGTHRVQRVPETEAQGRIHTSTCTVAIIPEVEAVNQIELNPAELKIDTFRSSGAGGQHVNVTDSAIRITHLPTGVVVECQDERSQHKNKAKGLALLKAKLLAEERNKQREAEAATRKSLVGTGERSERIRTYNFPQGRVTDHRINLTLYQLSNLMEGDLTPLIEPLIQEYNAERLARFVG